MEKNRSRRLARNKRTLDSFFRRSKLRIVRRQNAQTRFSIVMSSCAFRRMESSKQRRTKKKYEFIFSKWPCYQMAKLLYIRRRCVIANGDETGVGNAASALLSVHVFHFGRFLLSRNTIFFGFSILHECVTLWRSSVPCIPSLHGKFVFEAMAEKKVGEKSDERLCSGCCCCCCLTTCNLMR